MLDDSRLNQPTEIESQIDRATSPAQIREAIMRDLASQGKAQLTPEGTYVPTLGVGGHFSRPAQEVPHDFAKRLEGVTAFEDIAQLAREEQQRRLAGFVAPPVCDQARYTRILLISFASGLSQENPW